MKDRADRLVAGFYAALGGIFGIGISLVLFWYRHGSKWSGWVGLSICIAVGSLCGWLTYRFRDQEVDLPLAALEHADQMHLVRRLCMVIGSLMGLYVLWYLALGSR